MKLRHWFVAGLSSLAFSSFAFAATPAMPESQAAVPTPPALAHIGAFTRGVSYAFQFSPAEIVLGQHPLSPAGNIREAWVYARLFTDSGKQYTVNRQITDNKSTGWYLTNDGEQDPRAGRAKMVADDSVSRTVDPTAGLVFAGKDFAIKLSPEGASWSELNGQVTMSGSGSPMGKVGTAEYIPYIQDDGTSGFDEYTGQYQPVTGTVFGEPVKGMFVIDHFIGTELFRGSALASNEALWFKFANVYEDGSVEVGECFQDVAGTHNVQAMHGCVVTDGTKVIANSENPQVKFVVDANNKVKTETWSIGKMQWQYDPDAVALKAPGKLAMVHAYGGVHRVGDKRKIVNQFAIVETNLARVTPDQVVHSK